MSKLNYLYPAFIFASVLVAWNSANQVSAEEAERKLTSYQPIQVQTSCSLERLNSLGEQACAKDASPPRRHPTKFN